MKRAIHVALAALMLLGVIAGAGATPVAADSTDINHDDDNNGVDNDGVDIDDNHGSIVIDNSDSDLLDLDLL